MPHFQHGRAVTGVDIEASPDKVWRLLTDTWMWPAWGPSVIAVECPERFISATSRGKVKTALGIWLPFRVTGFVEGVSWDWTVGGVPATGHRIKALSEARCRLEFDMPWFAAPYAVICTKAVKRIKQLAERP